MRVSILAALCLLIRWPLLAADANAPIQTTLCEIVKNPEQFDGRMVRVTATVVTGFEASVLSDDKCATDATVWFSLGDDRPSDVTEYALISSLVDLRHPENLQWQAMNVRTPIAAKTDSEFHRLVFYLSKQFKPKGKHLCISCPLYSVTATFTGRFDYADRRLKAYRNKNGKLIGVGGSGFGHLGAWDFRLVMESVSNVIATKLDPVIYQRK